MFKTRFGQTLAVASAAADAMRERDAAHDRRFLATIPDAHTGIDAPWATDRHRRPLWRRGSHGGFRREWNRYFLANAENIGAGEFGRD